VGRDVLIALRSDNEYDLLLVSSDAGGCSFKLPGKVVFSGRGNLLIVTVQHCDRRKTWILAGPEKGTNLEPVAVTENMIEHSEVGAIISPEEAALVAEHQWSTGISSLGCAHPQVTNGPNGGRSVMLLKFSRSSQELDEAVLASPLACQAVADGMNVKPDWARGAKVLVQNLGPEHVEAPLIELLGPQHVFIDADEESLLFAALEHLPYRIRKLKPVGGKRHVPGRNSLCALSSSPPNICEEVGSCCSSALSVEEHEDQCGSSGDIDIQVRRTFIDSAHCIISDPFVCLFS